MHDCIRSHCPVCLPGNLSLQRLPLTPNLAFCSLTCQGTWQHQALNFLCISHPGDPNKDNAAVYSLDMRVIISGNASNRLTRVRGSVSEDTAHEVSVLSEEEIFAALEQLSNRNCASSASSGPNSSQKQLAAASYHAVGQPDPSAIVLLSIEDLCKSGLFAYDTVKVRTCNARFWASKLNCLQMAQSAIHAACLITGVKCCQAPPSSPSGNRTGATPASGQCHVKGKQRYTRRHSACDALSCPQSGPGVPCSPILQAPMAAQPA